MAKGIANTRFTNASDAKSWKHCRRRAWFDLRSPELAAPPDKFEQLIMHAGMKHEEAVLQDLGEYTRATDPEHTAALMEEKTPVIYQGVFRNDELRVVAQPDFLFLEKVGYRAADAKLARSLRDKPDARIQLAVYQRVLGSTLPTKAILANRRTLHELMAEWGMGMICKRFAHRSRRVAPRPEISKEHDHDIR